jgi:lipopolysaccharide export system protein LptA
LSVLVLFKGFSSTESSTVNYGKKVDKVAEKAFFKEVHYFKIENLAQRVELRSKQLDITNNIFFKFLVPRGYLNSENENYAYSAERGHMNQQTKVMKLFGDVRLSGKSSDFAAGEFVYNGRSKMMFGKGNVAAQMIDSKTLDIIKVKSSEFSSNIRTQILEMSGNVKGELIRQRAYEDGLKFESEEFVLNSLESHLKMFKSVKIYRNNYYLQSQNAEIFLENFNKKLMYYELYDDVKLEEQLTGGLSGKQLRRAYAEKLEGHQRTGKIILTGAPRVEQGDDIIKGYQITLRENVELVEVDDSQSNFSLKRKK